jgi:Protein of unknown function (DUF732)
VVEPQQKMTDHQDHDTEAAPTEQASPPTTELPPASHAAASPEAWSLDDTADLDAPTRHSRLVWSALVALVVAIAGALIFLATTLFGSGSPKPVEPKAQPTTTVPVAAPPPPTVTVTPPPTVTVTAEPPAPPPLSATDQQFLTALRQNGLTYPDPDYAISHAHATCDFMANHGAKSGSSSTGNYVARTTIWPDDGPAAIFAMYSAFTYCPQSQSE